MSVLREMKSEMRADLAALNTKMDDINQAVSALKCENETLRQENSEMRQQISKLSVKIDNIEGQSRRNNLRFYGIQGHSSELWQETENKIRSFISDNLGLENLHNVEIERAHRVGSKNDSKCPKIRTF